MKCTCENIEMGTYGNTTSIKTCTGKMQYIDNCILPTIKELWSNGIITHESCCGHGKTVGYIAVEPKYRKSMIEFGYIAVGNDIKKDIFYWPPGFYLNTEISKNKGEKIK